MIHGKVKFNNNLIDDQILMKSDKFPTYHFANIVDDFTMGITHVIRGVEWLPSTPKHIILYQMFGIEPPTFGHIPLLIHKSGAKLSKRHGDFSVLNFKSMGYLPDSILHYLAILGWTPPTPGPLTLSTLISTFSLDRLGKSSCKFDPQVFTTLNSQHLNHLYGDSLPAFKSLLLATLPASLHPAVLACARLREIQQILVPRIRFAQDLLHHAYFFAPPDLGSGLAKEFRRSFTAGPGVAAALLERLRGIPDGGFEREAVRRVLEQAAGELGREVHKVVRYAVTANPIGGRIEEV